MGRALPGDRQALAERLAEFVPFLAYSPEIRKVIYSTNAIESLHARFRRSVRTRGHFPNEQAAVKCLYLTVRSLDPTGRGRARWVTRWKAALNAFAITFEDESTSTTTNHGNRVYTVDLTLPPDTTVATYAYDDDEHLQSLTNASVGTTSYGYDAAGNLTTTTLPAGNDLASRPLKRTADLRGPRRLPQTRSHRLSQEPRRDQQTS